MKADCAVERAAPPMCSMCTKRVKVAVGFLAVTTEYGASKRGTRGASRRVKLCSACVAILRAALAKGAK